MLKVPQTEIAFDLINRAVDAIAAATRAGTSFVFGYVGGGAPPFEREDAGGAIHFRLSGAAGGAGDERAVVAVCSTGASCRRSCAAFPGRWKRRSTSAAPPACRRRPIFSSARSRRRCSSGRIWRRLSRSEMFIVMTGGMAGIAGTVFVLYATILADAIPNAAGHIVVCSVLGAPAAILISLIMVPDPHQQHTGGRLDDVEQTATSTMDAIVKGTGAGLRTTPQYRRHADRVHRAGASRQRDPRPVAGFSRRAADVAARARLDHGAGVLADGHSMVASRDRRRLDGDQDNFERAGRLSCSSRRCPTARSIRARG